jgi:hypothetical protein
MAGPTNFQAECSSMMGDRFNIKLYWDAVPGAAYYYLYRETNRKKITPPYDYGIFQELGTQQLLYNDVYAWHTAHSLDIFYWVSSVTLDPYTGLEIESQKSGPLTNIHPKTLRVIEEAKALVADDLRTIDKDGSVYGQVSLYNYKIAAHQALSDVNAEPTPTRLSFGEYPETWFNLLTLGTLYYILPKIEILETAKTMTFTDQGQNWNPPNMAEMFTKLREFYKEAYDQRRVKIKQNVRPHPLAVGSMKALYISPQFLKFRNIESGRPYF